ncbi:xylosidase/arabinosidase [Sodiomyces alkalinus F11]|uniref:Xylosidase/arabinosidase n=1 Tax=Sodiomyces alkalinus (strain CBS 110278 / VKM F-3762 / F11) TaxID=1314773 RepID=A0A3N2PUP6_SODAK|nr:xylosidase/arabinosidase [Sodiomyces alkalinus F11]ROT38211.1 xylosidase/arabinosidase [Sodiomyces alkalinus F11]
MGSVTEFVNPIVPGFAPDPSVIFVDGTFFLATSSFHVFPGLPIYASKDLKTWSHIGNALNRHSQLKLRGAATLRMPLDTGYSMVASMGIVAPTLRYRRGTFYIVTTNVVVDESNPDNMSIENFFIRTNDIWSNEWSDPVYFDFNGIDTSLFFDDDDRAYIQGCWMIRRDRQPTCTIKQFEIDIDTGKPLSDTKEIWPGYAKYDTEGPHIYKVGGWYFLMAAEGGTFEHHMLSIARSRDIWGPYETWGDNPILTADGKDEYIQNIGHGELFQDAEGRWWAAVLGVRKQVDGTHGLGRESFLAPVDWPEGGWPTVRQPRMKFTRETVPSLAAGAEGMSLAPPPFVEDLYIRDHDASKYRYADEGRTLSVLPSRTDLSSPAETSTFLGRRQRFLDGAATVRVDFAGKAGAQRQVRAGLALYKDPIRFAAVAFDFASNGLVYEVRNSSTGLRGTVTRAIPDELKGLELRIKAAPLRYSFEARLEMKEPRTGSEAGWIEVGSMEAKALDSRDFTGPILGVFAHASDEEGEGVEVTFRDFELRAREHLDD